MIKANKTDFYEKIAALYNLPEGIISDQLRKILLENAKRLETEENLYILADHLGRFVMAEMIALTCSSPKELVDLSRYIIELQKTYRLFSLGLTKID
ncbi:hypothetical protein ACVRZD_06675 [Streptococcus hongkongensis]|nr:hypothetical protein NC01_09945 [Streptococcus uberis]